MNYSILSYIVKRNIYLTFIKNNDFKRLYFKMCLSLSLNSEVH